LAGNGFGDRGLGIGLLLSIALTRLLTSSLLELELPLPVSATDPLDVRERDDVAGSRGAGRLLCSGTKSDEVDPIEALRYE
jgi:hypothetical protein